MSSNGTGPARGGEEDGNQGGQQGNGHPRDIQDQEELGDRIRREARNMFREPPSYLREILMRDYWDLASDERPTENQIITMIALFVMTFGQGLNVESATQYLANAAWDGNRARQQLDADIAAGIYLIDLVRGVITTGRDGQGNAPTQDPNVGGGGEGGNGGGYGTDSSVDIDTDATEVRQFANSIV